MLKTTKVNKRGSLGDLKAQVPSLNVVATSGFTLIEVLVCLAVITLGIVSVVGLQVTNLSGNQSATNRVKAVSLVADIAERIRSNPVGAVNGDYQFDSASYTPPGSVCNFSLPAGCDGAEIAAYDLWYWEAMMTGRTDPDMQMHWALPGVRAQIIHNPDSSYTIEVRWEDVYRKDVETHVVREQIHFFSQDQIEFYDDA